MRCINNSQPRDRVKGQEAALEEVQMKQQEELEALKKRREGKMKSYEKKQEEQDICFLLRKHATKVPYLMVHEGHHYIIVLLGKMHVRCYGSIQTQQKIVS